MSIAGEQEPGSSALRWAGMGVVAAFSMVVTPAVTIFLISECNAGRSVVEAYAQAVAAGAPVTEAVAGDEAARLQGILANTQSVSVSNFQAQAGTMCLWVTLDHGGERTSAQFLLEDDRVIGAAIERDCDCPEAASERCHLE